MTVHKVIFEPEKDYWSDFIQMVLPKSDRSFFIFSGKSWGFS